LELLGSGIPALALTAEILKWEAERERLENLRYAVVPCEACGLKVGEPCNGPCEEREDDARAFMRDVPRLLMEADAREDEAWERLTAERDALRAEVADWKADSDAAWDKCEERRIEGERLTSEVASLRGRLGEEEQAANMGGDHGDAG
jgi:hypothetical protein